MEKDALEDLLIDEMKIIFKYLIRLGATKEDAEDILQDTLYKTMVHIDALEESKVVSWMFKVATNGYYNLYKKRKRLVLSSNDLDDKISKSLCSEKLTEEVILNDEQKKSVVRALDRLKPTYKNLLIMKYFMDLPYASIARLLGFSEEKVKTYLYRARQKFKIEWEAVYYGNK